MAFMWLTELLECPVAYLELINRLNVFQLLNNFIDQIGNQLHDPTFEHLMSTVGNFVRMLTKKFNSKARVKQFGKANLFTNLVLTHFIESRSMELYYSGLSIIKNLLNRDAKEATDMIMMYEECVLNQGSGGESEYKKGFLD